MIGNLRPVSSPEGFLSGVVFIEPSFPVSISLGRSFAACFGCIALSTTIILGLLRGETSESILTQCLIATAIFAVTGWLFGQIADSAIRQSVEMNYRSKFEKIREKWKNAEG
ncbi:MAG: hypothetical protein K9M08_23735 [Pirellula sp.]|nr:hypothetical protein [Pirellula sp.]